MNSALFCYIVDSPGWGRIKNVSLSFLHPQEAERKLNLFRQLIYTVTQIVCLVCLKWAQEAFPLKQSKYLSRNKILICRFPGLKLRVS